MARTLLSDHIPDDRNLITSDNAVSATGRGSTRVSRLVSVRNRAGRPWTLASIGTDGLREVIAGPARLAGLDVGEVQEAMVAEARDEPGALPLVENALHWLWEKRTGNRLSGELTEGKREIEPWIARNIMHN